GSATVTITDNDVAPLPVVTIVATDANASETASDPGVFTVSRTGATTSSLQVNYTIGGSASNTSDYSTLSGSVIIGVGSSSATITVTPVDDSAVEGDETVTLTLSASATYTIGSPSSATVTITDNDVAPLPIVTIVATDANASETASDPGVFTVSRTGATTSSLQVNYTIGGSASNGT